MTKMDIKGRPDQRFEASLAGTMSSASSPSIFSGAPSAYPPKSSYGPTPSDAGPRQAPSPSKQSSEEHMSLTLGDEDSQATKATCDCHDAALVIMEELEVRISQQRADLNSDSIFSFQRRALDQCESMLGCLSCASASHSMMLLLYLCEKCVACSRPIWDGLQQLQGQGNSRYERSSNASRDVQLKNQSPRISFGNYELSSVQERVRVMLSLESCFLQRLSELLGRIESLATSKGWKTQLMMAANLRNGLRSK